MMTYKRGQAWLRQHRARPRTFVEGQYLELKRSVPPPPVLARSIAALANGGWTRRYAEMLIGVDDDGTICGVASATTAHGWREIRQTVQDALQLVHPRPRITLRRLSHQEYTLVLMRIDTLGAAHQVTGEYYIRDNAAIYRAAENEIVELRRRRSHRSRRLVERILIGVAWALLTLVLICLVAQSIAHRSATVVWNLPGHNTAPNGTNQYLEKLAQVPSGHIVAYRGYYRGADYLVLDLKKGQVVRTLQPPNQDAARDFDLDPSGQYLLFARNGQLWQVAIADGSTQPVVLAGAPPVRLPRFAPDGSGLFVVMDDATNRVGWIANDSQQVAWLSGYTASKIEALRASRDGRTVIVQTFDSQTQQRSLVRLTWNLRQHTLQAPKVIWQGSHMIDEFAVSVDGSIVYAAIGDGSVWGIDAIDTTTGMRRALSASSERSPRLAADGTTLLARAQRTTYDFQIVRVPTNRWWGHQWMIRLARLIQQWDDIVLITLFRHLPAVCICGIISLIIILRRTILDIRDHLM